MSTQLQTVLRHSFLLAARCALYFPSVPIPFFLPLNFRGEEKKKSDITRIVTGAGDHHHERFNSILLLHKLYKPLTSVEHSPPLV